jgi:hypothetical protein
MGRWGAIPDSGVAVGVRLEGEQQNLPDCIVSSV